MSERLVYLASPYSHKDEAVRQQRFEVACRISGFLLEIGIFAFSPIAHSHPIAQICNLPGNFEFYEKFDERVLTACDELWVLQMDGWKESKGVDAEISIARKLNKPVVYIGEKTLHGICNGF